LGIDVQEYLNRYGRKPTGQRVADNAAVFRRSPDYVNDYGRAPQARGVTITVKNQNAFDAALDDYAKRALEAARPSAYAMARVLYDETLRNVDRATGNALYGESRGVLKNAIYHAFSADRSTTDGGGGRAVYHISWNYGGKKSKGKKGRAPHGHLVEFGHDMPYVTRLDRKTGRYFTAVRPSKLAEFLRRFPMQASGHRLTVPEGERDEFFIRRASGPKWIAPRPFVVPSMAKFPEATAAGRKRFAQFMSTHIQLSLKL
jgi:hypothetical protein